jgi:hypothetical protein
MLSVLLPVLLALFLPLLLARDPSLLARDPSLFWRDPSLLARDPLLVILFTFVPVVGVSLFPEDLVLVSLFLCAASLIVSLFLLVESLSAFLLARLSPAIDSVGRGNTLGNTFSPPCCAGASWSETWEAVLSAGCPCAEFEVFASAKVSVKVVDSVLFATLFELGLLG